MIRQDVWDLCVDMQSKNEDYWNPDRRNDNDEPYQIIGEDFGNRTFDRFIESIKKVFDDPLEQMRHEIMSDSRDLRHVFSSDGESKLLMADYKNMCRKRKDDDDFLQDMKKRWYEFKMVEDCISNLRKGWIIQPGAGSQSSDWDLYKKFNIGLNNICDEKLKEYD